MEDVIEQFHFAEWRDLPSALTVSEVATILRLDPDTVYKSAAAGGIPGRKIGRQWRFSRDELIRWWACD
jgi:excisionase family DNA binding protein